MPSRDRCMRACCPLLVAWGLAAWAVVVLAALAPSTARSGGVGSALFGRGTELSVTLFKPNVWVDDRTALNGATRHLFTIPKNEYVGFYAGFNGQGTLATRSSVSLGRQDLWS